MKIEIVQVTKQFIRKQRGTNVFEAVKPLDLTLEEGTVTALSGSSGSGKSTLLNMTAGLLAPTRGTVRYGDTDLYSLEDAALSRFRGEHIGLIPQGQSALFALTVRENILLPAALAGKAMPEDGDYAGELMERLGIADLADVMPKELSGGELRRMAIARALIRRPEVILADEPTGDLDEENTQIVLELLRELADAGRTILLVTHDALPEHIADVCCTMKNGELAGNNWSILKQDNQN